MSKLPRKTKGRRLDGSWAGGKGSKRREGEDSAAFQAGYDAIDWSGDTTREPSVPTEPLVAEWQRQLSSLESQLSVAKASVSELTNRITSFKESKDGIL